MYVVEIPLGEVATGSYLWSDLVLVELRKAPNQSVPLSLEIATTFGRSHGPRQPLLTVVSDGDGCSPSMT
jgi:hypothetical protein